MRHALHDRIVANAGGTEILLPGVKEVLGLGSGF